MKPKTIEKKVLLKFAKRVLTFEKRVCNVCKEKVHDIGKESLQIFLNCDFCLLSNVLEHDFWRSCQMFKTRLWSSDMSCTNSIQTFEEIAVCPELHNNLSSAAAAAAHLHFLLLLHNFWLWKNKPRAKNLDLKVLEKFKSSYGTGWCTYDPCKLQSFSWRWKIMRFKY